MGASMRTSERDSFHHIKQPDRAAAFTIVELLIVVVIIAILATITVVTYNAMQNRARAAQVSAALNNAKKKLEVYKIDNSGYPTTGNLAAAGVSEGTVTYQYTSNSTDYCVTATVTNVSYYVNSSAQASPAEGGCPGHGQGGVDAITNLSYNPSGFSSWSGWSPWGGSGGGVISAASVAATWATRGRAVRSTWSVANTTYNGDLGWWIPNSGAFTMSGGTQYTATWKVVTSKSQRLTPAAGNWGITGGAAGTGTGTINSSSGIVITTALTPTTQWITFTTGPTTVSGKVYSSLVSGSGASTWNVGDYIEMSDYMLVQGTTPYNYADGNSTNWVWNGTANASTSTGPAP